MSTKFKAISVVLFSVSFVLLIVAFSQYWYRTSYEIDGTKTIIYTKYNKENVHVETGSSTSTRARDWNNQKYRTNEKKAYNIALALDVLAFVFITFTMGLLLFSFRVAATKLIKVMTIILAFVSLAFTIIGLSVFAQLPSYIKQDREDNRSLCDEQCDDFIGSMDANDTHFAYNSLSLVSMYVLTDCVSHQYNASQALVCSPTCDIIFQVMSSSDESSSSSEEEKKVVPKKETKVKKTKKDTKTKAKKESKDKKKKKKKDPNAPRRYLSPFIFFSKEHRPTIKIENPTANFGEIGALLGKKWETVTPEDKKRYEKLAAEDKKRWEMEKKLYDETKKAVVESESSSDSESD
ncbi:high mobility group box-containing protein [Cavenderia fasciculata]|uniref:High mobility group box-containing protein n=1 Tax=Cavenderia fasciculata TaxID=261658 RepID=F4PI84_CACFS|nr:high mobility group box-containing protein [Cavenderia fasciculata]EGG24518.1 high mobility group box-containing protein [Cavenderia fasciculata]|eukprot:XP_004362369.1 high mobility group box-containing protein [Cavenderia fasciculata]